MKIPHTETPDSLEANKHMEAVDAAWMNLAGLVAHTSSVPAFTNRLNDELGQAFKRVERARNRAGLLPLDEVAYVVTPAFY